LNFRATTGDYPNAAEHLWPGNERVNTMILSDRRATPVLAALVLGLYALQAAPAHAQKFNVTNLVSDGSVPANHHRSLADQPPGECLTLRAALSGCSDNMPA